MMHKIFRQRTQRTTLLMTLIFTPKRSKLLKATVNCLRTITRRVQSINMRTILIQIWINRRKNRSKVIRTLNRNSLAPTPIKRLSRYQLLRLTQLSWNRTTFSVLMRTSSLNQLTKCQIQTYHLKILWATKIRDKELALNYKYLTKIISKHKRSNFSKVIFKIVE